MSRSFLMYFCWDDVYMLTLINSCIYKKTTFKILYVEDYWGERLTVKSLMYQVEILPA